MPQHIPTTIGRTAVATTATAFALALLPGTPAAAEPVVPASPATVAVTTATTGAWTTAATTNLTRAVADAAIRAPLPSARGASAMSKALGKVGSPYRWGASGPSAFDCSGLVSWSYKQVGVALPRSSSAMSKVGTPVSKSELRPGDLVFFYKPVSHVAIYIGNGKVVHASTSSQPVKISQLSGMPFNSARRI